jgi:hypothetical protein
MNWIIGVLYEFSSHPFFNVWALPFIFSLATVGLGYWAFSRVFSRSITFCATAFLALNYWPVFTGLFCVQAVLLPFWECTAFLFFTFYWKASELRSRSAWALVLGVWTGLGFWTYLAWPVVALSIGLVVFALIVHGKRKTQERRPKWIFFTALLLVFLPFVVAFGRHDFVSHFSSYSILNSWFSSREKFFVFIDALNSLFWGYWSQGTIYVPNQGGLLNPLAGVFFLAGLWAWGKSATIPFKWVLFGLILFLAPGIFSHTLQIQRINQMFPLVAAAMAAGMAFFLGRVSNPRMRMIWLSIFITLSAVWDGSRLVQKVKSYEAESLPYRTAYQILRAVNRDWGPGLIFTEFGSGRHGCDPLYQGLEAATSPWNTAQNPRFNWKDAHWAALLTNVNFKPCLEKRLPGSRWFDLPGSEDPNEGPLVLAVAALSFPDPHQGPDWGVWVKAERWLRQVSLDTNNIFDPSTYQPVYEKILRVDPSVLADDFLAACYWLRLSDFYYRYDFSGHFDLQVEALQKAIRACPAAHLNFDLGCLLLRKHHYPESREALEKALCAPVNESGARQVLDLLNRMDSR